MDWCRRGSLQIQPVTTLLELSPLDEPGLAVSMLTDGFDPSHCVGKTHMTDTPYKVHSCFSITHMTTSLPPCLSDVLRLQWTWTDTSCSLETKLINKQQTETQNWFQFNGLSVL